ncbi:MAG: AEC family transporter [Limnohabitans sp.]
MPAIFQALLPVILLITCGYVTGRMRWVSAQGLQDLNKLSFNVLGPALLFHTLSKVHLEQLDLKPVMMYHTLTLAWLTLWVAVYGLTQRGCMRALAGTYSNAVMIGIPLITLAYGPEGQVYIMTLVSVHALIILTFATLLFELAGARANNQAEHLNAPQSLPATLWKTIKGAVLHPVSLPAFAGLMFAQTGWVLPEAIDKPMGWMGQAYSPLALLLVGIQLFQVLGQGLPWKVASTHPSDTSVRWHEVMQVVALKNLLHPLLILAGGWWLGLPLLPMTVMMVTACMPVGINSYLFATRYKVLEAEVSVSLSLSVICAVVSVPLMLGLQKFLTT